MLINADFSLFLQRYIKQNAAIMVRQADIIAFAQTRPDFSCRDMLKSFRESNLTFSKATVASCLSMLINTGVLKKIKRGVFDIAEKRQRPFVPIFDDEMQMLETQIRRNFNFVRFCVWDSGDIKRFSHYAVNMDVIFVDVERVAMKQVFHFLLNANLDRQVYLNPSSDDYTYYIYGKPAIVVRPLVSEAPLITYTGDSNRLSIEKLLVDVAIDDDFLSFQEFESFRIYRNAMDTSIINETKLLRYASRRGCKEKIKNILDTAKDTKKK